MDPQAEHWIVKFGMQAHPEGGYFAETYRSSESLPGDALPNRYGGARALGTSIYFLVPPGQCSKLHRLRTDEVWHYHAGGAMHLWLIHPTGHLEELLVGPDGPFQVVVPRGCWFGAHPESGGYSLVGCTMAPGFDFADFGLGEREALLAAYPEHAAVIRRLT
ncbi:MAG: cupin domain-containing protein [Bacteroidota bacterium]